MSRTFNLTLGSLATASAIAFAQSPIEPPRRAVPPAAPATPTAPASSKGAVVLPGATPPAVPTTLGSAPTAPGTTTTTTTTTTTPAPAAGSEVKPSIATGLSPAQNEALQKSRMRGGGRGFGPAGAGGPGGAGPAGAGAPATGSPLSTLIPGTPTSATPNPLTGNPAGAGAGNPAARGAGGNPADPFAVPAANPASSSANQIVELNDNLQATVDDVIADYEKNTGVTVLRANNLQGVVPISFNPAVKPSKAEYIDYLKAALMVNGFSIHEYSPTLHAITFTGQATPLFSAVAPRDGHKVYTRLVDLPERDEFVNFFMKFDYVTPQDAVTILGQPQHQSGKITPIPNAGGVLITESVPVIKSFLAIKKEIDVPSGELINRFVQLKLADAEEVAGIIQQILQQQNSASKSGQGGGGTRVIGAPNAAVQLNNQLNAAPGSPGAVQQSAPDASSVAVQADRRTNRILLSGKKNDITYIEKLIHDFDLPSEVNNLVTYQLRYIRVGDFIDLATGALEARGFGTSGGGSGGSSGAGGANSRQSGGNGFPADPRSATQGGSSGNRLSQSATSGSSRSGSSSSRSSGGSAGGVAGGGGGGRGSVGNSSSAQALPTSTTVGKTLLISDPQSNSIIVSGPPESRDQIRLLIEQMDKRPLQVFIDCVIAEVNLSDKWEFGLDLLRKVDNVSIGGKSVDVAGLFRNTSSGGGIIDPATLTNIAAFPTAATGLNGYFQVGELVNAYVKAAESGSRIKVVQKPSFATANNEPGHISIGQQVPYPGSQQSTVTNGTNQSLNSTVEYKDVLLSLDVTPLINSKNEVTLQIEQINDNISGERTINNDSIPVIGQQDLTTKLTVPNGGIAFIGGLITDSRSNSNSGAPFLARIPVLKYLLGASKKDDSRRELMIFIQPRIMETADEMIDVNSKEIQRTQIGPEAIKFARPPYNTRDVILPQSNGTIPFDQAGHPTAAGEKPGFWRRLGGIFKQKNNVPADPSMPVQTR